MMYQDRYILEHASRELFFMLDDESGNAKVPMAEVGELSRMVAADCKALPGECVR